MATEPVTSATHSAPTLEAASNPVAPVAQAVGDATAPVLDPVVTHPHQLADPVVGATAPVLDPVVTTWPPVAEAPGGLAHPAVSMADPITSVPAAETASGLAHPAVSMADPITSVPAAETASWLAHPAVSMADPITSVPAADSYLPTTDGWLDPAVVAGVSPREEVLAVGGDPGGIGGVVGSILDSMANGSIAVPTGTAQYASVVALVAAVGFTASRFGSAASGFAASSGGGIRLGVRLAWLASWDSARCVLASASGLVGTSSPALLASVTPAGVGGFAATQSATGGASATRAGDTVSSLFGQFAALGRPEGSSLPGLTSPAWSFGRMLRALLLLAGGLLALAIFPLRHRGQMAASPVRLSLAVMGTSILLAMGVVLLLAA